MFNQRRRRPCEELIPFSVTRDEAIAIGSLINSFYRHLATLLRKTPEQHYLATHLSNFYNRMTAYMTNGASHDATRN